MFVSDVALSVFELKRLLDRSRNRIRCEHTHAEQHHKHISSPECATPETRIQDHKNTLMTS
jgi:hypothetical protein